MSFLIYWYRADGCADNNPEFVSQRMIFNPYPNRRNRLKHPLAHLTFGTAPKGLGYIFPEMLTTRVPTPTSSLTNAILDLGAVANKMISSALETTLFRPRLRDRYDFSFDFFCCDHNC